MVPISFSKSISRIIYRDVRVPGSDITREERV